MTIQTCLICKKPITPYTHFYSAAGWACIEKEPAERVKKELLDLNVRLADAEIAANHLRLRKASLEAKLIKIKKESNKLEVVFT